MVSCFHVEDTFVEVRGGLFPPSVYLTCSPTEAFLVLTADTRGREGWSGSDGSTSRALRGGCVCGGGGGMVGIYEYTPQIHTATRPFLKFDMRHRGLSDMVTGIDIEEKYAESDSAFKSQSCQPSVKSMDTSVISVLESGRSVISMILRSLV